MIQLAIFNNKGGVGKTTYLYHIANILADIGICTLMVDCDSQCNLTAYAIDDVEIKKSWREKGNSIYRVIQRVAENMGDIRTRQPSCIRDNLYLVPGDIDLSIYEDRLGETWASASVQPASIRVQIAIYRYIQFADEKCRAQVILIDLGPNLGALNRTVLGGCDYFVTPLSPDLFSIKGTQNLGNKFVYWHDEWENNLRRWKRPNSGIPVEQLSPLGQSEMKKDYMLGKIPNLHSLIPYSLNAHKPVYKCTSSDGLKGAHISKARDSKLLYQGIVDTIKALL